MDEKSTQKVAEQTEIPISEVGQMQGEANNKKFLPTRISKKYLLIIFCVVFIICSAFLVLIFSQNQPTTEQVQEQEETTIHNIGFDTVDYKEVARETALYLESQKTSDGYNNFLAHFDEICLNQNPALCPFGEQNVLPPNNSWSALGFFSAYKMLGEAKYRDMAVADLVKMYEEYCKTNMNECLWVLAQPAIIYTEVPDPAILEFLTAASQALFVNPGQDHLMLRSIEARQQALLYGVTKDEGLLEDAKRRLSQARVNLDTSLEETVDLASLRTSNPAQVCWYTLAASELARQTDDPEYLVEAQLIETNEKISGQIYNFSLAVSIEPCIETFFILHEVTGDEKYFTEGKKLLNYFIDNFWDSQERMAIYGEGGVAAAAFDSNVSPEQLKTQVNVTETSHFLYLLSLAVR